MLRAQGIAVQQIHHEYTPSQYEISIAPASPVQAADRHSLLRATVVRVARRHGYDVSFAPVAIEGTVGNGSHVHLSAWRDERNLMRGGDGDRRRPHLRGHRSGQPRRIYPIADRP